MPICEPKIYTVSSAGTASTNESVGKKPKKDGLKYGLKLFRASRYFKKGWKRRSSDMEDNTGSTYIHGFYGLAVLAILSMAPFSATLLPAENVILKPEYWYELIFSTISCDLFGMSAAVMEMEVALNPFNPTHYE